MVPLLRCWTERRQSASNCTGVTIMAKWTDWPARVWAVAVILLMTVVALFPGAASGQSPHGIDTVFLIVMENHDWSSIKGSDSAPYLNSLLSRPDVAYASNYHNVPTVTSLHPSEGNYLWLEGGTNVYPDRTFTADSSPSASNSTSSPQHLVTLLQAQGIAWTSYEEDISGDNCPIGNSGNYTPRHNGILFFQDVVGNPPSSHSRLCQQHVRPYGELADDLTADKVHGYVVLIPNLCHDMHSNSCAGSSNVVKQGDDWLAANLPTILASKVYQGGTALVAVTWDEGGHANNPIGMILLSPRTKGNGYTNSTEYSHASWVKTVEQIFGLSPLVGHAADASTADLGDFFTTGGPPAAATASDAQPIASTPT